MTTGPEPVSAQDWLNNAILASSHSSERAARALVSIAASLIHANEAEAAARAEWREHDDATTDQLRIANELMTGDMARIEREAYNRGYANAEERYLNARTEAAPEASVGLGTELLSGVESTRVAKAETRTVVDLLSLVEVDVRPAQVQAWTPEARAEAIEWASAVHLSASDNDVEVPPKPRWLP